jgi:ribosomal protein RSM22 (predicted rRNA methylase)
MRYTSDRERLAAPGDRAGDLAARAVFFTVADAMKIAIPLGELANRGALPARRPLRVVDLGAGCGAMSLGLVAVLGGGLDPGASLEILAVDHDAAALSIAAAAIRALAARTGAGAAVITRTADAAAVPLGEADLVVMGSLLNELPADRALGVVERALRAISAEGAVIVIEPALRDTSRALHALRDEVIRRGAGHVFAPCTRRGAPCPALADPDDWCHEDRALALPPQTAELARLTHLRDGGMKFSYLVLRAHPLALVDEEATWAGTAWRVVSAPRPAKGKLEVIGCSDRGRLPLRLLRRYRTDANRAIERAERGDVLVTDAAPGEQRVELVATTAVERLEPARPRRPPA